MPSSPRWLQPSRATTMSPTASSRCQQPRLVMPFVRRSQAPGRGRALASAWQPPSPSLLCLKPHVRRPSAARLRPTAAAKPSSEMQFRSRSRISKDLMRPGFRVSAPVTRLNDASERPLCERSSTLRPLSSTQVSRRRPPGSIFSHCRPWSVSSCRLALAPSHLAKAAASMPVLLPPRMQGEPPEAWTSKEITSGAQTCCTSVRILGALT
mmetsp:Transcript_84124/g.272266  ORF Transcript_84124/g.272266 Transcript_84124/m.272266 type:complete len:210 (-) Transcript_84124:884-1513(-)